MWHEARKQEKKLRETMVNYQKRAERRKEHYDKLRGDPHQLLRVHGTKCKLHLDPKTASTLDSTMIPWQGDPSHIISQYDVRIHLDYIPDYSKLPEHKMTKEQKLEESRCNYERYRVLVKNAFHGLSESDALAKINVEEMYPEPSKKGSKKSKSGGSAIGYSYDDSGDSKGGSYNMVRPKEDSEEKGFSGESDYEVDMDVDSFNTFEVDKLNVIALDYNMPAGAFSKSLRAEKSELMEQKMLKLAELEKTAISGKMSRRERRTWKENQQQLGPQLDNVPSYTVRGSPTYDPYGDDGDRSRSRSTSPEFEGKVEYITSFGGNDDQSAPPPTNKTADKRTSAASAEPPPKSYSTSSRVAKKLSSEDRRSKSSRRGNSYEDSPKRKKKRRRRSSSEYEEYRSSYSRHRREDRYSPERRRSRSPRDRRSGRHRNSSYSRSRDRYSRKYRNDSYSRSRSRSRGHGRYRDRSREQDRYDDRRHRHYSSSSSYSSSSRDSRRPSRYHTKRRQSRSSSRDSLSSRSTSLNRNETRKKYGTRSKSRSLSPRLPIVQPPSDFVHNLSSPLPLAPPLPPSPRQSPPPPPLPPGPPLPEQVPMDSNDESSISKPTMSATKTSGGKGKLSHRERLMKKMQAQLNKQHKIDKKAVKIKEKKKKAEQMEREDLLREQQRKLKETQREELKEESYIYTGQAETYKMAHDSDRSSSPDSPTRLLMLGGRTNKNNKGTAKDNDFYYGRFS